MKNLKTQAKTPTHARNEAGAATIFTAVILMLAGTILAFMSARIVLNETKVTADDVRISQATEAALAAIDAGLAEFNSNGGNINTVLASPIFSATCPRTVASGDAQNLTLPQGDAFYYFSNVDDGTKTGDRCNADGATDGGTLYGEGWSDDCSAHKKISVCLGVVEIFGDGEGPKQPVVTGAGIGAFGNASVINRYTNISIWAGEEADVTGAAFATYLRPSNTETDNYSAAELRDSVPANNTQLVSNRNSGFGIDVVTGDISLANLNNDTSDADSLNWNPDFWGSFFNLSKKETKELIANGSVDQLLEPETGSTEVTLNELNFPGGTVWVDGDAKITGGTFGSMDTTFDLSGNDGSDDSEFTILIIDGDLDLSGNAVINGLVYVTGELKIAGTPTVNGTVISENGPNSGNGTLNIVYVPMGGPEGVSTPTFPNPGALIPGSWRDWE